MYLPEKPKAPVTAIRTPAFRQTEKIAHSARYRNAHNGSLFPTNRLRLRTGKEGSQCVRLGTGNLRQPFVAYIGYHIEQTSRAGWRSRPHHQEQTSNLE
jgi:hypothetical protein